MRRHSGYFQINQNQGAVSYLDWLLLPMTLQKLYVTEISNQPSSQKTDYRKEQS